MSKQRLTGRQAHQLLLQLLEAVKESDDELGNVDQSESSDDDYTVPDRSNPRSSASTSRRRSTRALS